LDEQDEMGYTPLHLTVKGANKTPQGVRALLYKGARKDLKTISGEKAIDLIDKSLSK